MYCFLTPNCEINSLPTVAPDQYRFPACAVSVGGMYMTNPIPAGTTDFSSQQASDHTSLKDFKVTTFLTTLR